MLKGVQADRASQFFFFKVGRGPRSVQTCVFNYLEQGLFQVGLGQATTLPLAVELVPSVLLKGNLVQLFDYILQC